MVEGKAKLEILIEILSLNFWLRGKRKKPAKPGYLIETFFHQIVAERNGARREIILA